MIKYISRAKIYFLKLEKTTTKFFILLIRLSTLSINFNWWANKTNKQGLQKHVKTN